MNNYSPFSPNEVRNIYNKYQSTSYNPNSPTLNMTHSLPQYSTINTNNLFLQPTSISHSYIKPKNEHKIKIKPKYRETIDEQEIIPDEPFYTEPTEKKIKKIFKSDFGNRRELLAEAQDLIQELKEYDLIISNELLRLRRIQQRTSGNNFAKDFYDFKNRLYDSINKTHDKIIETIPLLKEEFVEVRNIINDKVKDKLSRTKRPNLKVVKAYNSAKKNFSTNLYNKEFLIKKNTDKIRGLAEMIGDFEDGDDNSNYGDED